MKAFQVIAPNRILLPLINPKKIQFTYFSLHLINPKLIRIPYQKLMNQIVKQNLNKETGDTCKLTPVQLNLQCLKGLFKLQDGEVLKIRDEFVKFEIQESYGIVRNQVPIKITVKPTGQHKIQLKRNQSIQEDFV